MIPDIVIENRGSLYIFDPKYCFPNLSTALGEMHRYQEEKPLMNTFSSGG